VGSRKASALEGGVKLVLLKRVISAIELAETEIKVLDNQLKYNLNETYQDLTIAQLTGPRVRDK
jgi:hypothetical protein